MEKINLKDLKDLKVLNKVKVLRAWELAKESINHPCFINGKLEVKIPVKRINLMINNIIKSLKNSSNVAYTIGRTKNYDKALADKVQPTKKMGKTDDYEGGWVWSTAEEADWFIQNKLKDVAPDWKPEDFSVYKLELPNSWKEDVSKEAAEDGVHELLNDAIIVAKVHFVKLNLEFMVGKEDLKPW